MDAESVRENPDVVQADVPFAPLHAADVGAVESGAVAKLFLGEAKRLPKFADSFAESTTPVGAMRLRLGHRIKVYE